MALIETDNREYKRELPDDLEKAVTAFLNASGSELYIGFDDDGTVCGLDNYDAEARKFIDRVKNNITPSAMGLFTVTPKKDENDKVYLVAKIAGGSEKPYFITKYGMSSKGCFLRVGTQASPMTQAMIDGLYARRSLHTLHNVVSPRQNLTFRQLKIYYEEKGYTADGERLLQNLDFYTEDGKFNYVAYLMADENGISIKMVQYAGKDKVTIVRKTECGYCSLIKAAYTMLDALNIYNQTAVEITYPSRVETRLVEPIALREAVLNSIIHNDFIRGAFPVVEFYSDRVEITSSGGLPLGLTREAFFKGKSLPRNREIMRIFSNMELSEQLGSGMHRIMQYYKPEDFIIDDTFITARFMYNEHALAVLNGRSDTEKSDGESSEKVRRKFGENSEKVRRKSGEVCRAYKNATKNNRAYFCR
ncbi:MAG: putative DNA binding domain-containing protein [Clostridiales bacterium]|jgi:predicted HTH transcriptional regulator|nr:putative DNA binding domain-containing protein [Clostridiales bacterium]